MYIAYIYSYYKHVLACDVLLQMAAKKNPELLTLPEKTACKDAVQYVDGVAFSIKFLAFCRQFSAYAAS